MLPLAARRISRLLVGPVAADVGAEARFEEHAVGHRRRPRRLLHALELVLIAAARAERVGAARFGSDGRRAAVDEARARLRAAAVLVRRPRGADARLLLVP